MYFLNELGLILTCHSRVDGAGLGYVFGYAGIQHRHAGKLSLNSIGLLFSIQASVHTGLKTYTRYMKSYSVSSTLTVSKAFRMARVNSPVDAVP